MAKRQWLKLDRDVCRNVKVRKLAHRLRVTPVQAVGHLIALWSSAFDREETEHGDLSSLGVDGIELNAEWFGDSGAFLQALVDVGLLDTDVTRNFGVTIHDWHEYAGAYLKNREQSRARMQKMRIRKELKRPPKAQNNAASEMLRVSLSNVGQTPLRSTTASGSDAVAGSNQTRTTAARAASRVGKPLQPFTPDPTATASTQKKRAAKRTGEKSTCVPDPTSTSAQSTAPCSPQKPMPSTQSSANQKQLPAHPPTNTHAAGANLQSPARQMMHQQASASVATAPSPEILDQRGMSKTRIEDAFRTRWNQVIRSNVNTRTALRELLDKYSVTESQLDQAYADASAWHEEQGSKVHGTTIVQMLGTIAHHEAKAVEQQYSAPHAGQTSKSNEAMFELPDGRTAGRVFLTAKEQARIRSTQEAVDDFERYEQMKREYGVKS